MAVTASPLNSSSLMIRLSSDAGTTWDIVGFITSATMSTTMATREITSKLSCGWRELGEGLRSWNMSGDGLVTFDDVTGEQNPKRMFTLYKNRTKADIQITTWDCTLAAPIVGDPNYSGQCYITSLELTGGVEDNATYSFSFEGSGELVDDVNV
jgi:predicted secreted protein